jgi:hypothetical protein
MTVQCTDECMLKEEVIIVIVIDIASLVLAYSC